VRGSATRENDNPAPFAAEHRSALPLQVGEVFNPFQLFVGAMIPSAVLRNPDLSPSAKLVFARLAQFAGRQGKAWPSDQTLGREVGLGDRQTRRCVAELEHYGLIRRVSRTGHSSLFEFLWHTIYEESERTDMSALPSAEQGQERQTLPPVVPSQNGKEVASDTVGAVSKSSFYLCRYLYPPVARQNLVAYILLSIDQMKGASAPFMSIKERLKQHLALLSP
jgi:hypothetical protein